VHVATALLLLLSQPLRECFSYFSLLEKFYEKEKRMCLIKPDYLRERGEMEMLFSPRDEKKISF
jgi:hypothetical protein